ncbi:hypothetical protein B296_00043690 [Ensete ventricosum]|uniref:Calmodulin-binding domain-containing protein n=1 Tax=Ensete ventricosum TaxID=4639 RepID=A0A426XDD5_ENSVE|nr:hypothetical protein B296_00043690 [Ensete ventricosum]
MVQRKIGQQGSSAKEGGETKMRMNKETPRVMPNYMKPTTSSDARKEQRQVTAAADRKRRSNRSSNRSSQASVFCPSSQARALRRKLSSKLLRLLSSKRSFAVHPCPRPKVNRATCSSTLKDLLKFPKALELRPGGAEADRTSVTKVCPYKYCSLNGHWHADLPPLRCFLASRRKKMLEAHKCMKQKGVSPFRRQGSSRDTKQMDTGQAAVKLSSLIEEIGSDYFVEIYVKQEEDMECFKHEEHVILEGDVDHSSDLSVDDLEVMMTFLEYVSCEEFPSSTPEERWTSAATGKDHAEEVSEPSEIELEEDVDPFADDKSSFSDDELGTILGMLFENEAEACHEECSRAPEAESLQENGNAGSEDSAIDSDKAVSIDIKEDQTSSLLQVRIPSADQDDDIEDEEEEEDDHQIQSEPEVENDDLSTVGNAELNRRQKVALLVEAFETVIPLPVCDKPLRHATQSFSSPWPMQACS